MRKILFLRGHDKIFSSHVKLRDYFIHCLHHPKLNPYVYFVLDTNPRASGLQFYRFLDKISFINSAIIRETND